MCSSEGWYPIRVTIPSRYLERVLTSPEVESDIKSWAATRDFGGYQVVTPNKLGTHNTHNRKLSENYSQRVFRTPVTRLWLNILAWTQELLSCIARLTVYAPKNPIGSAIG